MNTEPRKNIVIFDGHCNLCNGWVRFIRKRDKRSLFEFVSAQSDRGSELLNIEQGSMLQTVVLIHDAKRFKKSDAVIEILKGLGAHWTLARFFKWIPRRMRDKIYDFVAKHRYRFFGHVPQCDLSEHP